MSRSWISISLVVVLLGLLALFAVLQYRWIGKISDAEAVRLERALQEDTERFTEAFNREIHLAYMLFQVTADQWDAFPSRYAMWSEQTAEPKLVKDIRYISVTDGVVRKYDAKARSFNDEDLPSELVGIRNRIVSNPRFKHFFNDPF